MFAVAAGPTTLSGYSGWVVLIAVGSVIILSGVVIIIGRYWLAGAKAPRKGSVAGNAHTTPAQTTAPNDADATLVRSWIAISLVAGLLIFCAVAFSINDSSLRSTLFGGLIASVGAAVAFYFSAKGADQARQDILSAALGTVEVPNLVKMSVTAAREAISKTPLQLVLNNPNAHVSDTVTEQSPHAGTEVRNGSKVSVTTEPPAPAPGPNPAAPAPGAPVNPAPAAPKGP